MLGTHYREQTFILSTSGDVPSTVLGADPQESGGQQDRQCASGATLHNREHLEEGVYFDSVEYAKDRIGIFSCKRFRILARMDLDDHQAANLVHQRARKDDPAFPVPAFQSFNMSCSMNLSSGLTIGAVKAENDELHWSVVLCGSGGSWIR